MGRPNKHKPVEERQAETLVALGLWLAKQRYVPSAEEIGHAAVVNTFARWLVFLEAQVVKDKDTPPQLPYEHPVGGKQHQTLDNRLPSLYHDEIYARFKRVEGFDARQASRGQLEHMLADHVRSLWPGVMQATRSDKNSRIGWLGVRLIEMAEAVSEDEGAAAPPLDRVHLNEKAKARLQKLADATNQRALDEKEDPQIADLRNRLQLAVSAGAQSTKTD